MESSHTETTGALVATASRRGRAGERPAGIARIAVGVNDAGTGRDAICLATTLAAVAGAEVLLVAVLPEISFPIKGRTRRDAVRADATRRLQELRDLLAPGAQTLVKSDWSVPRALEGVVRQDHPDLLVVGASRQARPGRVRIGGGTRQLLGGARCMLAVAPRGLSTDAPAQLRSVGVGYDSSPESHAALRVAGALAAAAGAPLQVLSVLDDRLPGLGWSRLGDAMVQEMWDETIEPDMDSLRADAQHAAPQTGAEFTVEAKLGSPPDELLALSEAVDLLVIGSRRWGAAARVLLGRTGEEVMHDARSPVVIVPRPGSGHQRG
jgi:nucleotide-binding universal stress UspA family protein